jgi:hypothetical protein
MNKREKRLLFLLYLIVLVFAVIISNRNIAAEIDREIAQARLMNEKKERLLAASNPSSGYFPEETEEALAAARQFFADSIDIYSQAAQLRRELESYSLSVTQFTVIEDQNQIEIVLEGNSSDALKLLEDLQRAAPAVRYNSLNIRRIDNARLRVVMRISYAES